MRQKATREYNARTIPAFGMQPNGELVQLWFSDTDLICANPDCAQVIPANTLFTVHTLHWYNTEKLLSHGIAYWDKKNSQSFCRSCYPFKEQGEE